MSDPVEKAGKNEYGRISFRKCIHLLIKHDSLCLIANFSVQGFASMSDYGGSVNGLSMLGVDGLMEKRRVVLNLYLLSNVSPMLMLIRSAWSNYLLVRPLHT